MSSQRSSKQRKQKPRNVQASAAFDPDDSDFATLDQDDDGSETSGTESDADDLNDSEDDDADDSKVLQWKGKYQEMRGRYAELQRDFDKVSRLVAREKSGKVTPKNMHRRRKSKEKMHKSKRASMPPVSMSPPAVSHMRHPSDQPSKMRSTRSVQTISSDVFALHRSSDSTGTRSGDDTSASASPLRHSTPDTYDGKDNTYWRLDDVDERTGRTPLIEAVIKGDKEAVSNMLAAKAEVNLCDNGKMTPLLYAVKERHVEIAQALINAGADMNVADPSGNTPLHNCILGATDGAKSLLELLLNYEHINIDTQNNSGNTPLALATHEGSLIVMRLLLGRGATPNVQNKNGSTPLLIACKYGDLNAVRLLLEYNSDPGLMDREGNNALHLIVRADKAAEIDKMELARVLLTAKVDVRHKNNSGRKAIDLCNSPRLQRLLEDYDPGTKSWRWEIDPSRVVILKDQVIGEGKFGKVYRGRLHGTPVAIKILHTRKISEHIKQAFKYEAGLMSDIRHPNVLIMMGIFSSEEGLALITEYMEYGSLLNFYLTNDKLSWEIKLRCALTTCRGLAWLHALSPPILHRDLHSKNILVAGTGDCKVSDFGLSQLQGSTLEQQAFYQRIMPPEVREDRSNYCKASDAYQFGLVLYELLTKTKAKAEHITPEALEHIKRAYSQKTMQEYIDLIVRCTLDNPTNRPSFEAMIEVLDRLLATEAKTELKTSLAPETLERSEGYKPNKPTVITGGGDQGQGGEVNSSQLACLLTNKT